MGSLALGRVALGAVWIWGLASLPESTIVPLPRLGRAVFWLLVVAHLVEIAFAYDQIRVAPGSLAENLAQAFLWGRLYLGGLAPAP